ncbi:hypothetical protein LZ31DRAFT_337449 [Colletotrichum somersetense]|nr:hypothetical protein LZ31DRAFT_337449 [Colletotrichum somersetense]
MTSIQMNYRAWADEQRRRRGKGPLFYYCFLRFYGIRIGMAFGPFGFSFLFFPCLRYDAHSSRKEGGIHSFGSRGKRLGHSNGKRTLSHSQPAGLGRANSDSGKAFGLQEQAIWAWHAWPGTAASYGTARPYVEIQRVNNGIWLPHR